MDSNSSTKTFRSTRMLRSRADTGFLQAVARSAHVGHVAAINMLCKAVIKANESPHAPDKHGWTPLHRAAYAGHLDAVVELLKFVPIPASVAKPGAGCTSADKDYGKLKLEKPSDKDLQEIKELGLVTPLHLTKKDEIRKVLQEALEKNGASKTNGQ
jgi:ankyrin repeat protein